MKYQQRAGREKKKKKTAKKNGPHLRCDHPQNSKSTTAPPVIKIFSENFKKNPQLPPACCFPVLC
jgi:hypothetical protein